MKKKLSGIIFCLAYLLTLSASAQTIIKGRIVCEEDSSAVVSYDVSLVDTAWTRYIGRTVTDAQGRFAFSVDMARDRKAILRVFENSSGSIVLRGDTVDLRSFPEIIRVAPVSVQLGEAVVKARPFRATASGYVMDLTPFKAKYEGRPAMHVIGLLPGVMDINGQLAINGRPFAEIYINGQRMTSPEQLQAITGDMLKSAEVDYWEGGELTNSTKATATLRIRLDDVKRGGYYGSVNDTYKAPLEAHNDAGSNTLIGSFIWKSQNGKWNINEFASYNYIGHTLEQEDYVNYGQADKQTSSLSRTRQFNHRFNEYLTAVYEFTPSTNVGLAYNLNMTKDCPRSYIHNRPQQDQIRFVEHQRNPQHQLTQTFYHEWGRLGKRFEQSADYLHGKMDVDHTARSYTAEMADSGYTALGYKFGNDMFKNTMCLHLPLNKHLTIRFGDAVQWVRNVYTPLWSEQGEFPAIGQQVVWNKTRALSHYASASVMGAVGRFYMAASVSLRNLDSRYYTLTDTLHSTQCALNPRASLKYMLDDTGQNSLEIAYTRDMGGVPYDAMSQGVKWIDANHYTMGNPNLKASTDHNLRLQWMHLGGRLNVNLEMDKVKNDLFYHTFEDPDRPGVYYTKPMNSDGEFSMQLTADYRFNVTKWWMMRPMVVGYLTHEKQTVSGIYYNGWRPHGIFQFTNSFQLTNKHSLDVELFAEPTFDTYDRTYRHVESVRIYWFYRISDSFNVSLEGAYQRRRTVVTHTPTQELAYRNGQARFWGEIRVAWHFKSKRDVKVKSVDAQQYYERQSDDK